MNAETPVISYKLHKPEFAADETQTLWEVSHILVEEGNVFLPDLILLEATTGERIVRTHKAETYQYWAGKYHRLVKEKADAEERARLDEHDRRQEEYQREAIF